MLLMDHVRMMPLLASWRLNMTRRLRMHARDVTESWVLLSLGLINKALRNHVWLTWHTVRRWLLVMRNSRHLTISSCRHTTVRRV